VEGMACEHRAVTAEPTTCACAVPRGAAARSPAGKTCPPRKADYGECVAPYLRMMDDEIRRALPQVAGG